LNSSWATVVMSSPREARGREMSSGIISMSCLVSPDMPYFGSAYDFKQTNWMRDERCQYPRLCKMQRGRRLNALHEYRARVDLVIVTLGHSEPEIAKRVVRSPTSYRSGLRTAIVRGLDLIGSPGHPRMQNAQPGGRDRIVFSRPAATSALHTEIGAPCSAIVWSMEDGWFRDIRSYRRPAQGRTRNSCSGQLHITRS
jgi:hypothetical protein